MPPLKDLTGKVFGKLTVLGIHSRTKRNKIIWRTRCECGQEHNVLGYHLVAGSIRNCSSTECKRKRPWKSNPLNSKYSAYKARARHKNLDFSLTKEDFLSLVTQNCHYCDKPPSTTYMYSRLNMYVTSNGIDRVDNSKGYTIDNCVPCCPECNYIKKARTEKEFLAWIKRVYENLHLDKSR